MCPCVPSRMQNFEVTPPASWWDSKEPGLAFVFLDMILFMIQILPDLICQNPRNSGSTVYMASCRIYIISSVRVDMVVAI